MNRIPHDSIIGARRMAASLCAVAAITGGCVAQAATVFQEDFESYAAGSSLLGQGGWAGARLPVLVNDTYNFGGVPTRVLDGITPGDLGNDFGTAQHAIVAPSGRYVLSFDVVQHDAPNTWGGLSNLEEGSAIHTDTGVFWGYSPVFGLTIRDEGRQIVHYGAQASFAGGVMHLSITVDPATRQVFGSVDSIDTTSRSTTGHPCPAHRGGRSTTCWSPPSAPCLKAARANCCWPAPRC